MKTILGFLITTASLVTASAQWIEWPTSAGGNGHSYLPIVSPTLISWVQAEEFARQQGGYLATLTSKEENDFVYSLVTDPKFWLRGEFGPLLGGFQPPGSPEPAGGWTWITGEPWSYSNWRGPQPDNAGAPEDCIHFWVNNGWNDTLTNIASFISYVVEREGPCTPRKAKATAQIVNGFVVGATLTDAGCGYTNPPAVLIKDGGGTGARARAVVSDGQVTAIQILDAGFGYETPPRIEIGSPPFVPKVSIAVDRVSVSQTVVLGWKYVLETSTNGIAWEATGPAFVAESESLVTKFDVDTPGRMFRLRVVQ